MKYVCHECREVLTENEVVEITTSYEYEYGVTHLFGSRTKLTKLTCPTCGELVDEFNIHDHYDYENALEYAEFEEVLDIMEDLYEDEEDGDNILFEVFKDEWEDHLSLNTT